MTAGTSPGTGMTIVINGPVSGRVITMTTDGFMAGTSTTTTTTGRTLGESGTLVTSGARATGKRAAGVRATGRLSGMERDSQVQYQDRGGQQWSNHSFFETVNVDQLINSLCRGDDDAATFWRIEVDPGEPLADTAAQSGVIDMSALFGRPKRLSIHNFGLKPRVIPGDNQAVDIGGKAKVLGMVDDALRRGRRQRYTEVYRGRQAWSPASDTSVSAQTSWCRDRFEQQHDGSQEN